MTSAAGRIGSSTAAAILKFLPTCTVVVASRSEANFEAVQKRRPELADVPFEQVDIDDVPRLESLLKDSALVVHAAGPFQRKEGARYGSCWTAPPPPFSRGAGHAPAHSVLSSCAVGIIFKAFSNHLS